MRILVVAADKGGHFVPFIEEQIAALRKAGCDIYTFPVCGKGITGYLQSLPSLRYMIKDVKPDVIHAHYGLCGLLANMQRIVPVVTTYHGSDINNRKVRWLSKIAMALSAHNIFVSQKTMDIVRAKRKCSLIPCGINLDDYPETDKNVARQRLNWSIDGKYVVFAGAFNNAVKNAPLAKQAVALLPGVELVELKGYSRSEVSDIFHAADALLMTSHTEGSPQVVKEALACGCPVVSVDVGDVRQIMDGLEGCMVVSGNDYSLADALVDTFDRRCVGGRERIVSLSIDNDSVVDAIMDVYRLCMMYL